MADYQVPYLLSFVVRWNGALLDGTPLGEAIARIDAIASPPPFCYLINCVHPRVFEEAMTSEVSRAPRVVERVIGLQANASSKSPEELDGLASLDAESPELLADSMSRLHRRFGIKILGGCCGTDHRHISEIANRVAKGGWTLSEDR